MAIVGRLATELDVPERTLRRAVALGTVRARRLSPRRLRVASGEIDYLLNHWGLLSELRGALRTEREVRTAVLFSSMSRGEGDAASDIDLLVKFSGEKPMDRLRLGIRLEQRVGRKVDVASLSRAEQRDSFFLLQVIDEGRVIVDRDGDWPNLHERRPAVYKRAMRAYDRQMKDAGVALDSFAAA